MKQVWVARLLALVLCVLSAEADTVILRDGASYSGQITGPNISQIGFTDGQGIGYKFPVADVQSLVLSRGQDTVTRRNGKVYAGQYNGPDSISFRDGKGIDYNFPLRDIETIVFTENSAPATASSGVARVVPRGTEIVVHTDENIDSENSSPGQLSASPSEDVPDSAGGIVIPRVTRAKLMVRNTIAGARSTAQNWLSTSSPWTSAAKNFVSIPPTWTLLAAGESGRTSAPWSTAAAVPGLAL
jgi:hypothetical protein